MSVAALRADRPMEFAFGADDHAAISRLAYAEAGIVLPPGKSQLVYGRLVRRIRACEVSSFAEYIALLDTDREERTRAIDALTTNHTSFFRESHHYEHFMAQCWPTLSKRLAAGGRVRLWSAACSSGEEPYSLVMAMLGKNKQAGETMAKQDLRILATDLSGEILLAARAGRYSLDTIKTIPADLRGIWVQGAEGGAAMRPEVKAPIAFRPLNLLGDWPMRHTFDAIFCRNVMIYFDESTKARLQSRLADALAPGGFLYIGHSERLSPEVAPRFTCVGRTTFQKVAA